MRLKLRVERAVVGRMEEGCHLCRRVGRWLFLALLVGVGSREAFGRPPGWVGLPDGTLDPRFGVSGIALTQGVSSKSVLLPDGKIIVVGQTLARHNVDGSLDATFGDNGVVPGVSGDKVLLQRDGKLLIVSSNVMARYNADGSPDAAFGGGGSVVTPLRASDVALQADGRILLVGSVRVRDIDFEVVRYNADGSLDSTFGNAGVVVTNIRGDEAANAVVAEPGGKIVVAGQGFGPTSLRPDFMLVRYQPDGTLDFSFGSGGVVYTDFGGRRDSVVDLLIQPDGKIVAGGLGGANRLNIPDDFVLARYLANGSLDASFNNGGTVRTTIHEWSSMTALDLQVDGKIVAVGRSFNLAFPMTVDDAVVVQYRADGTVDRNFGVDGVVYMRSPDGVLTVPSDVDVQPDGQILVTWGRSLARYRYDSVRGAFGGTPHSLPGRIEAEHYDVGGQSTGYFDTTPGNEQDVFVFRTDDVDIKVSREGGHTIGWFAGGEWLAYTANLARPGIYVVEARVGSVFPGRTFHIEVDGRDVTGPIAVPQVPEWDTYETVRVGGVELAAGIQVLRVVMGPEDFMDFKWLAVVDGGTWAYGGVPHPIPGVIEAEEYDLGGQGVGYFDTTPGNEQGHAVFRGDDVDIKESREGGYTIGWLAAGEWLAYTADVQRSGRYAIEARVGSVFPGRTFHVEVDGRKATGPIAVPQVAEWDTYQTVRVEGIELGAGIQMLRVVMGPQDFMDFQWLQLVRIAEPD